MHSALADNPINNDQVFKGEKAEEIDGMLHKVEYLHGSPQYLNLDPMLKSLNTTVYPEDRVTTFPNPSWGLGSKIIIKRASVVSVKDGNDEKTYRTWKINIKDFLSEQNIIVGDKDIVEPNLDTQLLALNQDRNVVARNGREQTTNTLGQINITRVAETEITESESISYKIINKKDSNLEKGLTRIDQQGTNGKKELTYQVRRENGKEVSRVLIKTEVVKEPADKIVVEGTKVVVYGTGTATWYNLIGGMTAASNTLPYGAMVHVVNTSNGKSVDVKIIDHGIQGSAIIDLSDEAFVHLAPLGRGTIQVRLEKL